MSNKTPPNPPISLTDVWLPSFPPAIKPTLVTRTRDAMIAKIHAGSNPSPATIRQLTGALESFHPASASASELTHREIYSNPKTGTVLLIFWIPESAPEVTPYAVRTKGLRIRTRELQPIGFPLISNDYVKLEIETAREAPPANGLKKRHGHRLELRKARQSISHIFPGLIKIVVDWHEGTLKTSFEGATVHKILKHRELYAAALAKFGFATHSPDTNFKLGTWRVKTGGPKKKFYHVLTLYVDPNPKAKPARLRVDFTPTWARKIVQKTDDEIDEELSRLLTNRDALIKRLKIKTINRRS